MEKYKYHCDGGSLLLGNKDFRCNYMNNYGDGCHTVYIKFNPEEKFPKVNKDMRFSNVYHFEGMITGIFNVYNYDCLSPEEADNPNNILITLRGSWGVYSCKNSGDMLLAYWSEE